MITNTFDMNAPVQKKSRSKQSPDIKRYYFGADEQHAISLYQNCVDVTEKNKIYIENILPAFDKLVENLICIYKFTGLYDSHDDLKNDCITFLYETLGKFDASRGTKAFSYFNVVAKHWLIVRSKKRQTALKRMVSLDAVDIFGRTGYTRVDGVTKHKKSILDSINEQFIVAGHEDDVIIAEKYTQLMNMFSLIREKLNNDNEIKCIDSIITLFEKRDDLPMLNKRAVFTYIREMSDLTPKQLTMAISAIKKQFNSLKHNEEIGIF